MKIFCRLKDEVIEDYFCILDVYKQTLLDFKDNKKAIENINKQIEKVEDFINNLIIVEGVKE